MQLKKIQKQLKKIRMQLKKIRIHVGLQRTQCLLLCKWNWPTEGNKTRADDPWRCIIACQWLLQSQCWHDKTWNSLLVPQKLCITYINTNIWWLMFFEFLSYYIEFHTILIFCICPWCNVFSSIFCGYFPSRVANAVAWLVEQRGVTFWYPARSILFSQALPLVASNPQLYTY